MNLEIEVRILDIDVDEIREKLINSSGILVKKENQINKLFDFEDRRLLNLKGYGRIRIVEDLISNESRYYMTVKKRISSDDDKFKVMDEHETQISSSEEGENIFKSLGLIMTNSISKYRESYKLLNVLVEIDINDKEVYPIPYIEIEGDSMEDIEEVLKKLGYTLESTTSKNLFELIDEYNKNKNKN